MYVIMVAVVGKEGTGCSGSRMHVIRVVIECVSQCMMRCSHNGVPNGRGMVSTQQRKREGASDDLDADRRGACTCNY
jgi:hypothetical protein